MRRPTQQTYNALVDETRTEIQGMVQDYSAGRMSLEAFADKFGQLMTDSHAAAAWYGRMLGGDLSEFGEDDALFGAEVWADERTYVEAFMQAISDGAYIDAATEEVLADAIYRRAASYTGRLRGTANEAWVWAQEPETLYYWVMGAVEDHCDDCPDLAAASPYTAETLPSYPGENRTPCLFNCQCHLRTDSGAESFKPYPD